AALRRYGVAETRVLATVAGAALENLRLHHPFYEREVPIILGEHVSAEDGTGAVHTAPGHGQEDFAVGLQYGLIKGLPASTVNPVGASGAYLADTAPVFGQPLAGVHIWKANAVLVAALREHDALL